MYFENYEGYSNQAFSSLNRYFKDKIDFDEFVSSLPSDEAKDQFLRIASFYRYLVKDGSFKFIDPELNKYMSYIDDSYKYIAVFALIESIYESEKFVDFYTFIKTKRNKIEFPIESQSELDKIHERYKEVHGSIKMAIHFFDGLDELDKEKIKNCFAIAKEEKPIIALAKLMYQIRSEFVHRAKFVLSFGNNPSIGYIGKKVLINSLNIKDLMVLFEHGLLRHFGYKKVF